MLYIGLFTLVLPQALCSDIFCSVDEVFLLPVEMQVRVSEDLNKEELNQNQPQPLGCIAAGSVLQGFGVCVSLWNPSCWMIEVLYLC